MRVAFMNANRTKPPIALIGLEYVAEAVDAVGHQVEVLDLCWAEDWASANQMLADAIRKGHRGAYWDILRKILQ